MTKINWQKEIKPLISKYRDRPHPLEFKNLYQLFVMVILSAQDSDKNINNVAPELFKHFPNMKTLASTNESALLKFLKKVRNHRNKISWLLESARQLKTDKNIPLTMAELVKLPGIGRKSANVIMRGAKVPAEGVMVDLHVVRVAPRLGIASGTDPKMIEQQIMQVLDPQDWQEAGMAMSFLGRETCRPSHPEHQECVMTKVCAFYRKNSSAKSKRPFKKSLAKATAEKTAKKRPEKNRSLSLKTKD